MKKLTIEHLAPYLPYSLKWMFKKDICNTAYMSTKRVALINPKNNGELWKCSWINLPDYVKPILRNLSDLTKEIEVNGEKFVPIGELSLFTSLEYCNGVLYEADSNGEMVETEILNLSYFQIKKLFEWHFDVFGLIEKGLAVDINTL